MSFTMLAINIRHHGLVLGFTFAFNLVFAGVI